MSHPKGKRYNPRWHGPKEIVPELDTRMVDLSGNFIGTLGQIWARNPYRNIEVARKAAFEEKPERDRQWEARRAKEEADNHAAQGIAYEEYQVREGHPHPLFAGTVATASIVEQPTVPDQEQAPAPVVAREVREPALAR